MSPPKEFELEIEGMTCDSCVEHVKNALQKVEGVVTVKMSDLKEKKAFVKAVDDISENDLVLAVKQANYSVKSIKTKETSDTGIPTDELMSKPDFDLVVIGTGGAGMAAAISAAEEGKKVAIVEKAIIGGTCVNIGCVPSKTLIRAAEIKNKAERSPFVGIKGEISLDWQKVIEQKSALITKLRKEKYVDVINSYEEITLIKGKAVFNKQGELEVNNKVIKAKKVVIATGARPKILKLFEKKNVPVLTSTTVMELEKLPKSMIVIGGRAVALELGQMLHHMGVKVKIIQRSARILPKHDLDIALLLQKYLEEEGIEIYTNTKILDVKTRKKEKIVIIEMNNKKYEIKADEIFLAVGRTPNTDNMGIENIGIELTEDGFIKTNTFMQTTSKNIYAAGDVTTLPKLVYVAAASGNVAAFNAIHGNSIPLDLSVLPVVIFTSPQVATVGLTEDEAKKQGYDVMVSRINMDEVPYDLAAHDTRGMIKLIADKTTNKLLGAHIVGANAGEIIQTAALLISFGKKYGTTIDEILNMLFPYLTQVEGIKLALIGFKKDVSKLSCCAN